MPEISPKRMWKLGGAALAATRARRATTEEAARHARQRLTEGLADLKGIPQKIGQIFALAGLGDEESGFHVLGESRATALDPEEAERALVDALGAPLERCFRAIDLDGIGASIGQVHRAELLDGRRVAVKVQYPGIARAVRSDLGALRWIASLAAKKTGGFDLEAYRQELGARLGEELDYTHEADALRAFRSILAPHPAVVVPEVFEALSNARVLTMSWVDGEPFAAVREWSAHHRTSLGEEMLRVFFRCVDAGFVHADPNPGNYRFWLEEGAPRFGMLDFGCVKRVEPDVLAGLRRLLREAAVNGDAARADDVLAGFVQMGFSVDLLAPIARRLPALNAVLFAPFGARAFDPRAWRAGPRMSEVLEEDRYNFRFAGPADVLYLIRAFHGLVAYLSALDVPLAFGACVPEAWWAPRGEPSVPKATLTPGASTALRIRVTDHGEMKVSLTFRAGVVEQLEDLVPDDVLPALEQRGIDVAAIGARAVASHLAPGELFRLEEGKRTIRVWLE